MKLFGLLSDNMVLQRHTEVPIWGTAEPGERITITLCDQRVTATADNEGRWMIRLKPLDAGGPFEMAVTGKDIVTLRNVLIGVVWVCSGQSNMQLPVKNAANAEQDIAAAEYPLLRLFSVAGQLLPDIEGQWVVCSPQTAKEFSAVGYFFGRELHKALGVPVGLIHSSWWAPVESWISLPTLESDADFLPILNRWKQALAEYPRAMEEYEQQLAQWNQAAEQAKSKGQEPPRRPPPPRGPNHPHRPAWLYNDMLTSLIPYAIQGVIWYQGESNAYRAYQYRKLFPALIRDWRRAWGQGDFPFLFVQLANFGPTHSQPGENDWAELREAQLMALALPQTAMAVAIDIGEADDIHMKNKQEVGRRLALAALPRVYGQEVVYSGPIYESMAIEGSRVRLRFKHVDGGLLAKGGEPLKGFAVAGQDRKFVWADAHIDGDTVVAWSDQLSYPVAVRYAWAQNPVCNLYNMAGLPASPFRTDDWPGITMGKLAW